MKSVQSVVVLLLLTAWPLFSQTEISVMTYNIRLNTSGDGEHAWPHRRADLISQLKFHGAAIFCLQEALHDQVTDVRGAFPGFGFTGVGRDDGREAGEYSPVLYDTSRFMELSSGHFWLSETPGEPSLGWDAACIRICSWIKLKERSDGSEFYVFNTHFDHVGNEARSRAAALILEQIESLAGREPVILCGDFNLPPEAEPITKIAAQLHDSFVATESPPLGPAATYSGFTCDSKPGHRIDYIFVSKEIRVLRYGVLTDSRDGHFFSDHRPVLVEVSF